MIQWKLFLDDYRIAVSAGYHDFYTARSYAEAVKLIEDHGCCPVFVAFDHDLSDDHYEGLPTYNPNSSAPTGLDFAKYLIDRDLDAHGKFIPKDFRFAVHSMNPAGAENIQKLMDSYLQYKAEPFTHL